MDGDISRGPLGIASFLEHSAPWDALQVCFYKFDGGEHVKEITEGLRHCPEIAILILSADIFTPEFLEAFTIRDGDEANNICPQLLSLTSRSLLPSPPVAQILEMLRSRRDILKHFCVEEKFNDEVIKVFGPEIKEYLLADKKERASEEGGVEDQDVKE